MTCQSTRVEDEVRDNRARRHRSERRTSTGKRAQEKGRVSAAGSTRAHAQQDRSRRTRAVLAPDADGGQLAPAEHARAEERVQRGAERAAPRVDRGPRLPDVVVSVYKRFLGEDGAVAEETAALTPAEAFVEEVDKVRAHTRGIHSHQWELSCREARVMTVVPLNTVHGDLQ